MDRVTQSPTDPALNQNPYPFYDRIRPLGLLVWWEDYNMPVAASQPAVSALLRDRRFGRENPTPPVVPDHQKPFYAIEAHSMLELEPPRHTRLRGLVLRAFTSRRIKELAPEIETLSHQLIDAFPDGPFDLLTGFAQQLPVIIIARLLGVPEDKAPDLLRWSNAMVRMYMAARTRADEEAAAKAAQDFSAYLAEYVKARRAAPADDLITQLIAAEEDGERLTTDELITTCILLLNAGHEATVHTLGNGVKTALQTGLRPDDPDLFAEEVLRFDPPLHMFTRYATDDMDAFGHHFKKGEQVGLLLGAANRDPEVYADPNRFDPARALVPHSSFGSGLHFCVGAPLARLELSIALKTLFDRCPDLALAEEPEYATSYHFHGLTRLMVTR
ncbi:Cytochrome P450 [Litoreibacter ascidiaceicola]|uniref:Cytochrome P450 n=1 Tax=Litoreibacter ascidiaceicola TaxID=1486859 RepID=A0A1M4TLT8_9RHOB|nr:cytochrome P450 [Litoreibacter ascidiaceicola]SHE45334.1 Cytochrome P450 [Litoreibacter ascidiaceicola]